MKLALIPYIHKARPDERSERAGSAGLAAGRKHFSNGLNGEDVAKVVVMEVEVRAVRVPSGLPTSRTSDSWYGLQQQRVLGTHEDHIAFAVGTLPLRSDHDQFYDPTLITRHMTS